MSEDRDLLLSDKALVLPAEAVRVPELGEGKVIWIRGMNGEERDAFEAAMVIQKGRRSSVDLKDTRAKLVVRCAVEAPKGEGQPVGPRLFRDDEYPRVSKIRGDVLGRLHGVAQRLSGISDEDIDELGKASPTTPGASSSSSSPGTAVG
jgi:hypothetical protein